MFVHFARNNLFNLDQINSIVYIKYGQSDFVE